MDVLSLGRGSGPSSQLTEQPTPTCVSLGKGSVIYDSSFDLFKEIGHLCRLCKAIAGNSALVKPGGAQCLPSGARESHLSEGGHAGEAVLLAGWTATRTPVPGMSPADTRVCLSLHPPGARGV